MAQTASRRTGAFTHPRTSSSVPAWKSRLRSLPRTLWLGLAGLSLLSLFGFTWLVYERERNLPVNLFAYELNAAQVRECSEALSRWNVPHGRSASGDNLLVLREGRVRLLARLAEHGLPSRDLAQSQDMPGLTPTRRQQLMRERVQLEESLSRTIRTLRGVQNATVTLAIPEHTFGEEIRPTASVVVHTAQGYSLPRTQAFGIAQLLVGAVPGLRPEDVAVLDSQGTRTNDVEGASESWQLELKKQVEGYLASKAQKILDKAYGQGRAECALNVDLDFSQMEVRRSDAGPGAVSGEQKMMEVYQNTSESGALLVDENPNEKKYQKICEVKKHKNNEAYTLVVHKLPRIEKVTCAVLIEQAGQSENALALVRGAIGFDANRGDEITLAAVPLPMATLSRETPVEEMTLPAQSQHWLATWALMGAAGACFLLAVGLHKIRRGPNRPEAHLQAAPNAPQVALCDLNQGARGESLQAQATATRSLAAQLEEKAREHPKKVASMLSSTYLQ